MSFFKTNYSRLLLILLMLQPSFAHAITWTLSVDPPGAGDACLFVSGQGSSNCTSTKQAMTFPKGSFVQLTQNSFSGYQFVKALKNGEDITNQILSGFASFGPVPNNHNIVFYYDEIITVDAGSDQTLTLSPVAGASTSLQGSGNGKTYSWTQIGGAPATISDPSVPQPTVSFSEAGDYLFLLTVTGTKNYAVDTVKITVQEDPLLQPWTGVFSGSILKDNTLLTAFDGSLRNGMVHIKSPAPTVSEQPIAPSGSQASGSFKIVLYNLDPLGEECNASGTFTLSNTQIDGSGSWSCPVSGQQGSWTTANYIDAPACTNTTDLCARLLIPDVPVTGIVLAKPTTGEVTKANLVVLDASNSFSKLGNNLSYSWKRILPDTPIANDSWYLINSDGSVTPWSPVVQAAAFKIAATTSDQIPPEPTIGFVPPAAGEYQFEVTVSNGTDSQSVQTPVIDIAAIVPEQQDNNLAPTVTLKPIKKGTLNKAVTLSISALDKDMNPDDLTVLIRQNSGPVADASGYKGKQKDVKKKGHSLTASAKVKPLQPGNYGYIVTVSDGKAASSREVSFPVANKKK